MKGSSLFRFALFSTTLGLMVALVLWARSEGNSFFRLQAPKVTIEMLPHQQATAKFLQPQVQEIAKQIVGMNIWRVGLQDLQAQIWRNNWFSEVQVERRFPNQLHLKLQLANVALLFQDSQGQLQALDWQGQTLANLPATQLPPAPLLFNVKIYRDEALRRKVLSLLQQIPQIGVLRWDNIASVDYHSTTGLALELIQEGAVVYMGESDLKNRSLQVLRVVDYLKNQNQKARVIDASFAKKVLVRPRKGS